MRIEGFKSSVSNISDTNVAVLEKLKIGDTVRAQVIENSGNELTLKMMDGSKISANAKTPIDAAEGEFVNFVYKGTIDGKPALEVEAISIQPQTDTVLDEIKNTLTQINLPVTEENIELALALKKQGVAVNSETLAKTIDLLSRSSDIKTDSAAFLVAANMSNDKNNIENLQNLLVGKLKISNDIDELLKLVDGGSKKPSIPADENYVNNILEKLISDINKSKEQQITSLSVNKAGVSHNENSVSDSSAGIGVGVNRASANTNNTAVSTADIPSKLIADNGGSPNLNNLTNVRTEPSQTQNTIKSNNINNQGENLSEVIKTDSKNYTSINIKSTEDNLAKMSQRISDLIKGEAPVDKSDLLVLNKLKSGLDSMLDNGDIATDNRLEAKLLSKEINALIFKADGKNLVENQKDSSINSIKTFEEAVNNLKNLFIKIDQSSDEINPIKTYKTFDDAVLVIKNSIHQLPIEMREIALNITNNLESNINFINQLNSYSSYLQLPLSIFGHNTTGELYMLKKGSKSKKLDASNITILLSLDSNNIGRIDTLLSVDKKNISTNFRLENSEVFDTLKDNHKLLYKNLLEKGYRLVDYTYRLIEEPINIVNFEAEAKKEFSKSNNNINILI